MLEQERHQRRVGKEAAEKAKGAEWRVQVTGMAETGCEAEDPVTRDRENGDRRIQNDSEIPETQGFKESRYANTAHENSTPPVISVV